MIRKARLEDVQNILDCFTACTDRMLEQRIKQWDYSYPKEEHIKQDIKEESAYVISELGRIATITLNTKQDEQYLAISWTHDFKEALVIHRLAVHPELQGQGHGKRLCLFAEEIARKKNIKVIRLDAYSENKVSNELYQSLGYHQAEGFCYFHGNSTPFNCYEKLINKI